MKLSKYTPDRFWKITIETDLLNDDIEDNEEVPIDSIEQLIIELELITGELRKMLSEEAKPAN